MMYVNGALISFHTQIAVADLDAVREFLEEGSVLVDAANILGGGSASGSARIGSYLWQNGR